MRHNKIREGITIDIRSFYKNKIYPNLYAIEQKIQRFPYHHYAEMHANDGRMKISDMRHPKSWNCSSNVWRDCFAFKTDVAR